MQISDTKKTFGTVSILNHWASTALIFILIGSGLTLEDMARGPEKFELVQLHKSFGAAFLIVLAIRLAWRLIQGFPQPAAPARRWEAMAARLWHLALLAVITALPVSGWISVSSAGHEVTFFGLFALPDLVSQSWPLHETAENVHGLLGHLILPLIALHAAAALKHHFWDRDETFKRMLGWGTGRRIWRHGAPGAIADGGRAMPMAQARSSSGKG